MAKKKAGGSTKNGRDSIGQHLGIKKFGGQKVNPGNIIIRQRGSKFYAGKNTNISKDYTILATKKGYVEFNNKGKHKYISVVVT